MAHWRDGGMGNMAGSDDRPIEQWTLLERLNNLLAFTMAGGDAQELAYAAAAEIERLRGTLKDIAEGEADFKGDPGLWAGIALRALGPSPP